MNRNLLLFIMLMAFSGFSQAQVVADFEAIPTNLMLGGAEDLSTMIVVVNPDMTGINTSNYVLKFTRDKDGVPYGGFWSPLPVPVDVTDNKYVHVKVWKPRISPIKFKLEGGDAGLLETPSMSPQANTGMWEDMVFDFTSKTGTYPIIAFMPDFEEPLTLTEDIVLYFDDIMVNNDPTPNSASAYVIEDYESIPLNLMLGGAEDQSTMTFVANPDKSGINTSNWVVEFVRDKDGVPYGGFFSALPVPVDVTDNKYVHVKVWKPRISPIKFKLEGGDAGTLETPSMSPQTSTGVWEDMVFDFSSKTGTYPTIVFMPDFEEPLTLTEDITIYFDDIEVNNIATPITEVVLNVDMHGSGLAGETVYFAGDFDGIYGVWNEPGTNPVNELTDPDNDSIYSNTMELPEGTYHFKFFKGAGWNGGEWNGDPNRTAIITGNANLTYKWGVKPAVATFKINMKGSGLAEGPVSIVGSFGGIYGTWSEPGTNTFDAMTAEEPLSDSIYAITMNLDAVGTYQFKFFKGSGWTTGEWDGDPNRTVDIAGDTTFTTYYWGVKPGTEYIGENPLAGNVSVYPVPFNNYLNVTTSIDLKSIVVTSPIGQKVAVIENPGIGSATFYTSKLSTGLYFVTFYPRSGSPYTLKTMKN